MVETTTIVTMGSIVATALIGVIIALIVIAKRFKEKGVLASFFYGLITFFVAEYTLRLPFLNAFSTVSGFDELVDNYYVIYTLFLAVTTAAFELFARWFALKIFLKGQITYGKAFSAGFGHGALELLVIIGYTMMGNIFTSVMINEGVLNKVMLESGETQEKINTVVDSLVNANVNDYYIQLMQQVFLLAIQVGLTMLLAYFILQGKQLFGMVMTLLIHTAVNFGLGIINGFSNGYFQKEIPQLTGDLLYLGYAAIFVIATAQFMRYAGPRINKRAEELGFRKVEEKKQFPKFTK